MRLACPYQLSPTQNLLGNGMQLSARNAAAGGDPYWADVVLLAINDNAADGSTTFVDQSSYGRTQTAAGNAQYDTAQAPSGMTSSGLFDGTGDYVSTPDATSLELAANDFTIEAYIRFNTSPSGYRMISSKDDGGNRSWYFSQHDNTLKFGYYVSGGATELSASWTPSTGIWYHVAAVRNGTEFYFFIDGTQLGTTLTLSATIDDTNANHYLASNFAGSNVFDGWICNYRLTIGTARYTADFTPPTLPLPTS